MEGAQTSFNWAEVVDYAEGYEVQPVEGLIPSVFPGRIWAGAVVGSVMAVSHDHRFDQSALLRWADDGGRSVQEEQTKLQQVRI